MTEAQKGLRERNMGYSVRNYLLGFRRISGVNILVQKVGFPPFGGRLASLLNMSSRKGPRATKRDSVPIESAGHWLGKAGRCTIRTILY